MMAVVTLDASISSNTPTLLNKPKARCMPVVSSSCVDNAFFVLSEIFLCFRSHCWSSPKNKSHDGTPSLKSSVIRTLENLLAVEQIKDPVVGCADDGNERLFTSS